jgi:DNA-binding transcriptional LysR family regulator
VTVAEELNFHRAAKRLYMTQPALSRQVQHLERDLGTELLRRGSGPTALTSAGAFLLAEGRSLLAAADETRNRVRRFAGDSEALTFGFFVGDNCTAALRRFASRHPSVDVRLHRLYWYDQERAVRDGVVDVAFVHLPVDPEGLELLPIREEPRMVVLPRTHRLAGRDSVTFADIAGEPMVVHRGASPEWEDAHDCSPRPDGTHPKRGPAVSNVEEKVALVAAGRAISFVPRSVAAAFASDEVVYLPLDDAPPFEICLAYLAGRQPGPVTDFVAVARLMCCRRSAAATSS